MISEGVCGTEDWSTNQIWISLKFVCIDSTILNAYVEYYLDNCLNSYLLNCNINNIILLYFDQIFLKFI